MTLTWQPRSQGCSRGWEEYRPWERGGRGGWLQRARSVSSRDYHKRKMILLLWRRVFPLWRKKKHVYHFSFRVCLFLLVALLGCHKVTPTLSKSPALHRRPVLSLLKIEDGEQSSIVGTSLPFVCHDPMWVKNPQSKFKVSIWWRLWVDHLLASGRAVAFLFSLLDWSRGLGLNPGGEGRTH